MKTIYALAATAAFAAIPASAATTVAFTSTSPDGEVRLVGAGSGAVAGDFGFTVSGTGDFTVIFDFVNPFDVAAANGSASFNFDPDLLLFTGGTFSGGGIAIITPGPTGSEVQVDRLGLGSGTQTLTLFGTLNSPVGPVVDPGGTQANNFARVAGTITLTGTGAIPEPATWALFILGFGAIGGALRRRSGAVRVSKAKLHFA